MATYTKLAGYLGGPIARCDDEQAHGWRNYVIEKTPAIEWNNPMARDFRYFKGHENPNNNYDEAKMDDYIVKLIIEGDKTAICDSDICLYNVWQFSAGTMMEMIFSWEQGKHNIAVLNPELSRSPWITYHSKIVLYSIDDAIDYINSM